jgi:ATP-binding cassette subfamily F protein 3
MSSADIAEELRISFPGTDEIVVQYLSGYLVDDAGEDEDVLQVARMFLESVAQDRSETLEKLMLKLADLLEDRLNTRLKNKAGPELLKLDKVMDMSMNSMSSTIALSGGVDLESINKGKFVESFFHRKSSGLRSVSLERLASMSRSLKSRRRNSKLVLSYPMLGAWC